MIRILLFIHGKNLCNVSCVYHIYISFLSRTHPVIQLFNYNGSTTISYMLNELNLFSRIPVSSISDGGKLN